MDNENAKFNDVVIKIKTAFELLTTARQELSELGIDVNAFEAHGYNAWGSPNNVFLRSGLNRVSVLSEKEIESINDSYGKVMMDGFLFDQPKIPVERIDRYA